MTAARDPVELTPDERRAIASLKRLARQWPKTLWLFSASGTLTVMRTAANGERVYNAGRGGEGADPAYRVDSVDIPNDGGDW